VLTRTCSRKCEGIRGKHGRFKPNPALLRIIRSFSLGQFTLILKCESCLRERRTTPHLLANICGWDARLEDVVRRMRCSICGKKSAGARGAADDAAWIQIALGFYFARPARYNHAADAHGLRYHAWLADRREGK
jgi:hypothetical protein